jgi:hypothetical protein
VIGGVFESMEKRGVQALDRVMKPAIRDQHLDARPERHRRLARRPADVLGLHFFSPAHDAAAGGGARAEDVARGAGQFWRFALGKRLRR